MQTDLHSDAGGVNEGPVEVLKCSLGIISCSEAHKAKLP